MRRKKWTLELASRNLGTGIAPLLKLGLASATRGNGGTMEQFASSLCHPHHQVCRTIGRL